VSDVSTAGVPPVTVAVVSWNTRDLLAACLSSLQRDAGAGLADVWVVDNASSDGSAELVRRQFPWTSLVACEQNLGFGSAVNLVAARTTSRWLAPANADIRLGEGALERLLATGRRHPEAGVIAPRLILPDGSTQRSVYPFPSIPFTLAYVLGASDLNPRLARRWCTERGFDPGEPREIPWAVGAFLLIRRPAWEEVGGFDPGQWMYAEDLDLGWRLARAGWKARYEPQALVHHVESAATALAWGDARHARWHANSYAWMMRRRGAAITRAIAAINVVGFSIRAALTTAGAILGSRRARRARHVCLQTARAHLVGLRSRTKLAP
jgi:GT2 family glycosyltransferase